MTPRHALGNLDQVGISLPRRGSRLLAKVEISPRFARSLVTCSVLGGSVMLLLGSACLAPPSARVRTRVGSVGVGARSPDLLSSLLGIEVGTTAAAHPPATVARARSPVGAAVAADVGSESASGAVSSGAGPRGPVALSVRDARLLAAPTAPGASIASPPPSADPAGASDEVRVQGGVGAAIVEAGGTVAGAGDVPETGVSIEADVGLARRRVARGTRLADLLEGGWVVDGARIGLADLVALAPGRAGSGAGWSRIGARGTEEPPLRTGGSDLFAGGSVGATAELEHLELPTSGGQTRLVVRVTGRAASAPRGRLRVHLVIDRSSSMDGSWHHVLEAARQLVSRLAVTDTLQIVVYADGAQEIFGPAPVGDGRDALARLERVTVGGGTNIEAGLSMAYRSVASAPVIPEDRSLVFLVSDGRPNIGAFAAEDFARLSVEARARRCTTTVFGVGDGFDGDVLRAIARAGRGSYYVARTAAELTQPLVNELALQERIAGVDVRLRVRLPGAVQIRSLDGTDATRDGNTLTAVFPVLRVGEERLLVLSLGVRASLEPRDIAAVDVSYRPSATVAAVASSRRLRVAFSAQERFAGASSGVSLLDHDLARALDEAGAATREGDGQRALRALAAHVARARERQDLAALPSVRLRTDAVARLATGIAALLPAAREHDRRLVGLALGGAAARLGR